MKGVQSALYHVFPSARKSGRGNVHLLPAAKRILSASTERHSLGTNRWLPFRAVGERLVADWDNTARKKPSPDGLFGEKSQGKNPKMFATHP